MGPAVSWLCAIGMIPRPLTSPTVGLIPTIPFMDAGHTTDPSVSVPTATMHRFAATPAPDPELDPHGFRSSAYGFRVCPPRPLHPLTECGAGKFAPSLKLVSPRIPAPAVDAIRESLPLIEKRIPSPSMNL